MPAGPVRAHWRRDAARLHRVPASLGAQDEDVEVFSSTPALSADGGAGVLPDARAAGRGRHRRASRPARSPRRIRTLRRADSRWSRPLAPAPNQPFAGRVRGSLHGRLACVFPHAGATHPRRLGWRLRRVRAIAGGRPHGYRRAASTATRGPTPASRASRLTERMPSSILPSSWTPTTMTPRVATFTGDRGTQTTLISTGPVPVTAPSDFKAASDDGQRVIFATTGQFTPSDTDRRVGPVRAVRRSHDAPVSAGNSGTRAGSTQRFSPPCRSPEANRLIFVTADAVLPSDTDTEGYDVYRAMERSGSTSCSSNPNARPSGTSHGRFIGAVGMTPAGCMS